MRSDGRRSQTPRLLLAARCVGLCCMLSRMPPRLPRLQYITLLFTDLGVLTPAAVSDELIQLYV